MSRVDLRQEGELGYSKIGIIQNTKSFLCMNNSFFPYDCIKDTSTITHSIIHEHKYT